MSLIEVLVAIGVVAVGILALLAVFVTGTRSVQHGDDLSRATYYARKITETIRQGALAFNTGSPIQVPPAAVSGLNDPPGVFRAIDWPLPIQFANIRMPALAANGVPRTDAFGAAIPNPYDAKFQRNISIRRKSTVATAYDFDLLLCDVTVRWQSGKSGDGMRRVKIVSILKRG